MVEVKLKDRTIYKQGAGYVVVLPIEWIRSLNLQAGDILEPIVQQDGALVLIPRKQGDDSGEGA